MFLIGILDIIVIFYNYLEMVGIEYLIVWGMVYRSLFFDKGIGFFFFVGFMLE